MAVDETHEQDAADDDGVELPADEPGATDEPGPSDDEQEAEAEDDEPTPEPEHESQGSHWTPEEWEKRNRKAEQRFATYEAALQKIYEGEFSQLAPCPLCIGATRAYVVREAAGRVPDDQANLVKHFLGIARPIALRDDPETETCATCGGEGKTATGSKVPGHTERPCPTCKGYGYSPPPSAARNGHVPEGAPQPLLSVVASDIDTGDVDDWREPRVLPDGRENPNFGKMPQFKIRVEPWGATAGLTAQDAVPAGGS